MSDKLREAGKKSSMAVAATGGTGFASVVLLFPDSIYQSLLLILSPVITVLIGRLWEVALDAIDDLRTMHVIKQEEEGAVRDIEALSAMAHVDAEITAQAQRTLNEIRKEKFTTRLDRIRRLKS